MFGKVTFYINVVSLTFDGGSSNIRMAESLGAKFCYHTNFDLSIPHPITKESIFLVFDACHAIKLVRNTLVDKKYCLIVMEIQSNGIILKN